MRVLRPLIAYSYNRFVYFADVFPHFSAKKGDKKCRENINVRVFVVEANGNGMLEATVEASVDIRVKNAPQFISWHSELGANGHEWL